MSETLLRPAPGSLVQTTRTPGRRRILGIDPGSRITGYGLIESDGRRSRHLASGCVRVGGEPWPERLGSLFEEIAAIVARFVPDDLAVEQVFFARDAGAALKLGQARGAAICAALQGGVRINEYSPKSVKLAVVGTGAADKVQVQHMVKVILCLEQGLAADQADALAVAICHAHSLGLPGGRAGASSWRDWRP